MSNGFGKCRKCTTNVIPAKAGIQEYQMAAKALDPGFRRGDDFLRTRECTKIGFGKRPCAACDLTLMRLRKASMPAAVQVKVQ
jgi:hypothetical protein